MKEKKLAKKYRLLKNLPRLKAGAIFEESRNEPGFWINSEEYMKHIIEDTSLYECFEKRDMLNEDWFESIKE